MRALTILGLCIGAVVLCAWAFFGVLWFTLEPSDAFYHAPPFAFLFDPFFLVGLAGSLPALALALLVARFSGWRLFIRAS